jgi:hypothetical protein
MHTKAAPSLHFIPFSVNASFARYGSTLARVVFCGGAGSGARAGYVLEALGSNG